MIMFALSQATLGLSFPHFEMRSFAASIAAPQQQPPPLGKKWLRGFLTRNPEIHSVSDHEP
jgi:hypothetical protein